MNTEIVTDQQPIIIQSPLQPSCMFCFTIIEPDETIITKEGCSCSIVFHTDCIQTWLHMYEDHPCPLCRTPVTFIYNTTNQHYRFTFSIILIVLILVILIVSYYIHYK